MASCGRIKEPIDLFLFVANGFHDFGINFFFEKYKINT